MGQDTSVAYISDVLPAAPNNIPSHLRKTQTFLNASGSDIAVGMAVIFDETDSTYSLGESITIAPGGGALGDVAFRMVGVTVEAIADGERGQVCVGGLCFAEVAAGLAANEPLTTDGAGTAGHLEGATAGAGTEFIVGQALEAIDAQVTGQALVRLISLMP